MADEEEKFHRVLFRRIQDWGVLAGLILTTLTIIFMLLPIYRKQVQMEDKLENVAKQQSDFNEKYVPLIVNSDKVQAVLNTKVDGLSAAIAEVSHKLDSRGNFR